MVDFGDAQIIAEVLLKMNINMKYVGLVVLGVFVVLITFSVFSMTGSIYGDEYMFLKVTENLPDSSTSANWLLEDRPDLVDIENNGEEFYHLAYDTSVWIHPLLPNYLIYPLALFIDFTNVRVARIVPLVLTLATVFLVVDVLRRRYGLALASVSVLPFILSVQLLGGGLWLYYDSFLWLFFALSLWLIFVKPRSKWLYVSLGAMLVSKEMGVILLVPLLLTYYLRTRNVRSTFLLVLPISVLFAWYIYVWVMSGDVLYLIHHWESLRVSVNVDYFVFYLWNWGGIFFIILTIPGLVANIKNKEAWPFILLYIIMLGYGVRGNFIPYQMFSLLFAGMMLTVLSVKWFCNLVSIREEVVV